jgi:hypothetical protein
MTGLGAWSSRVYAGAADMLTADNNEAVRTKFVDQFAEMGQAFCKMTNAVKNAGLKDRAEAQALLSRYSMGVGIAFELLDKVPGVAEAKGIAEKVPGGVAGKMEDKLKEAVAADLSGVNYSEIVARTKKDTDTTMTVVDHMVTENMMGAIARRPQLMCDIGMKTWGKWPPFMLKDPAPAPDAPAGPFPDCLGTFIKPEFLDGSGGVRLPAPGSASYKSFQQWYMFSPSHDNDLYKRALVLTAEVRHDMNGCMAQIQFQDSM